MKTHIEITPENFSRINCDVNGNSRFYLPVFMASEKNARKIGGVKYRGKKFGPGWVFQTFNVDHDCQLLNTLERGEA